MLTKSINHEFVHHIPKASEMQHGVAYVSVPFAIVVHPCCCGCGNEVVTPLDPKEWQLTFDGKSISLSPSIGNWQFDCKSHYWIHRNRVRWVLERSSTGSPKRSVWRFASEWLKRRFRTR